MLLNVSDQTTTAQTTPLSQMNMIRIQCTTTFFSKKYHLKQFVCSVVIQIQFETQFCMINVSRHIMLNFPTLHY